MTIQNGFVRTIALSTLAIILCGSASSENAAAQDEEWATVKDTNLKIQAGSPLDFSAWSEPRIQRLPATEDPGVRLNCASLAWSPATGGFPDHKTATQYAEQLKRHGYNVVRFQFVEATLMTNRSKDFDFEPTQLDNWHFFLSELKKQGIYWVFDALSSDNGAVGNVSPNRWAKKYNLKEDVYFSQSAQEHWKELTRRMLTAKNKYTGTALAEDPALLGIILVNEPSIDYLSVTRGKWPEGLQPEFNRWLKKQNLDSEKLARRWQGDRKSDDDVAAGTVGLPASPKSAGPKATDVQRFITELERDTGEWMTAHLRKLGYKGWITSYNNWPALQTSVTRSAFEWVDMHGYHDESFSWAPGTKILQTSSLDNGVRYARWLALTRQKGKPFSLTEYGQPFWNQYRYEAGLTVPAMARLQGWNFICLHSQGAVDLSMQEQAPFKRQLLPYGTGLDPVARAGETVAAAIQLRGDVAPLSKGITVPLLKDAAFSTGGFGLPPDEITYLAWLTRIAVDVTDKDVSGQEFPPVLGKWRGSSLKNQVALLKRNGLLPQDNVTDPSRGVFQSANGDVLLDSQRGMFLVTTGLTEAVASKRTAAPIKLGAVTVKSMSSDGLVSFISLDNQPIRRSRKMLIVMASDAENTGMKFADGTRKQLAVLGKLPARIKRLQAQTELATDVKGKPSLTSLHLNGDTGDALPVALRDGKISIPLDNTAPAHGPTTFFLLTLN